jgi:hypothetical protein
MHPVVKHIALPALAPLAVIALYFTRPASECT